MAKKIKYPDVPMRDSVIDRVSVKTGSDMTVKNTPNKYKETMRTLTTTSSDDGSSAAQFTKQSVKTTNRGSKEKVKDYFLSREPNEESQLQVSKKKSGSDLKQKIISGNRAERKFANVLKRN